jgi:hypothetical protein
VPIAIKQIRVSFRSKIDCRGRDLSFLPSELATIGFVIWGSARFYNEGAVPVSIWVGVLAAWTLVFLGTTAVERKGDSPFRLLRRAVVTCFGLIAIILISRAFGARLSWSQATAVGIIAGAAISFNRWLLSVAYGRGAIEPDEGIRWVLMQALAVYAVHPFVRGALVGAGDAYHYSITLADYIRQARAGIFPVFVGQSEFAFNGNVHTVRTAPFFTHFGALLDGLTLHTLPFYAVTNLAIVFSAVVGVLGTYAALLRYAPGRATTASALAALYILSPAILAPLYKGDMFTTFMTVPMIPWWVLGLAMAADEPAKWPPWLIQAAALAGMWWAHPPIAVWATAITIFAWIAILIRQRDTRSGLERITAAALLFAILAGYVFISVDELRLVSPPVAQGVAAGAVLGNVEQSWRASLLPLAPTGNPHGDIQLGYSLVAACIAGLLASRFRNSAVVLFGCIVILLIPLFPIPGLTERFWSLVPNSVLHVTHAWPMQRLYPLLAALAAFAALSAAPERIFRDERRAALIAASFAVAIGWSMSEAQVILPAYNNGAEGLADSTRLFREENISLARSSYQIFGFSPGYFSLSPTNAFLETRLIDTKTMSVLADGSTTVSGAHPPGTVELDLRLAANGDIEPEIPVGPSQTVVLRFAFLQDRPQGVLQLTGRTLFREYRLPVSGEGRAFGSEPRNGRVIALQNTSGLQDSVRMDFIPDLGTGGAHGGEARPFAHVAVEPLSGSARAIDLQSLLPFRATVEAERPAVLETPKIYIPGYRALVNAKETNVLRTAAGLVGVPVGAGKSEVIVDYPGSRLLRYSYGMSACAWLAVALFSISMPLADPSGDWGRRLFAPQSTLWRARHRLPALALVFILLPLAAIYSLSLLASPHKGALRLVIKLPIGGTAKSEPLVTTGRTFAGDVIYLNYLGDDRISVGHDRWGKSVALSEPFVVDFLAPQVVEISMESLGKPKGPESSGTYPGSSSVSVRWNGTEILLDNRGSYPAGKEPEEIGKNLIGASTCSPQFTGEIMESAPISP